MTFSRAYVFEDKGLKLLSSNRLKGAEKSFIKSLHLQETLKCRNNLAYSIHLQGEPERALQTLEPILQKDPYPFEPNPFTHALASQLFTIIGQKEEGRKQLEKSITLFDSIIEDVKNQEEKIALREYTMIIMKAAATLGDHQEVLNLYERWKEYHTNWHNSYLGGIGAFNMGHYALTVSILSSLKEDIKIVSSIQKIAQLIDKGEIPPFTIDYDLTSEDEMKQLLMESVKDEKSKTILCSNKYLRLFFLDTILQDEDKDRTQFSLEALIVYGGDWGCKLGFKIIKSNVFPTHVKIQTAFLLQECRALPKNSPIQVNIDGKEKMIETTSFHLDSKDDSKLTEILERADGLKKEGHYEEAINILEDLLRESIISPTLITALSILYRINQEIDKAFSLLESVEDILDDDPMFLINYSSILLEKEDFSKARHYFDAIDPLNMDKDLQNNYRILKEMFQSQEREFHQNIVTITYHQENIDRIAIEKKKLPLNPPLIKGLKNMPDHWLDSMITMYRINTSRKRKEKERAIAKYLLKRKNLRGIFKEMLKQEHLELLSYLLEKDGWAKLNVITRKYGKMENDGFYWDQIPPSSSLGKLWSMGLVMVGKTQIHGRNNRIVTVPQDLQIKLNSLLPI